jgi:hypothetical protein
MGESKKGEKTAQSTNWLPMHLIKITIKNEN